MKKEICRTGIVVLLSREQNIRWIIFLISLLLGACGRTITPPPGCAAVGIDVSRHQGEIDWRKVADAGIAFAWIKATEGGDYLDPAFHRNWIAAGEVGIKRGAYHFVYWCRPAKDQAAWFVANVPDEPDALPPVLDVEWNVASRSCPGKVARDKARPEIGIMIAEMRRAYAKPPIVYAPADIFADLLGGAPLDADLWARDLGSAPAYGEKPWRVWQYSETGSVPGIDGPVDLDCLSRPIDAPSR